MTRSPIDGFITKKEVESLYNRSHRSLTRDITAAVRLTKSEVLDHLRLRTEDGEVLIGTEVSADLIHELSSRGLAPTWYIEQAWAADQYPADDVRQSQDLNSYMMRQSRRTQKAPNRRGPW